VPALRIVGWNANRAFQRKLPPLLALNPDVAVISECERDVVVPDGATFAWVGDHPRMGLGVLGFDAHAVELNPAFDRRLQWAAPIDVRGPVPFTLIAVWAYGPRATEFHPSEPRTSQVQQALTLYAPLFETAPVVFAGDFNNNVNWDRGRPADWAVTVERLEAAGLVSTYHESRGVPHGGEPEPTLYWRDRRRDGPTFHIDFCFVPRTWNVASVEVGSFDEWVAPGLSDHVPLVVDVETDCP
jgi:exodeoxyribonuclease III